MKPIFASSRILVYAATVTALSLLMLYLAATLPTMRIAMYFISSLFVYVLSCEKRYAASLISFAAVCALAFLMVPNKLSLLPYVALLGHFGVFKPGVDALSLPAWLRFIIQTLYCDIFAALGCIVAVRLFAFDPFSLFSGRLPAAALLLSAQLALVLYVWVYDYCRRMYLTRLKPVLLKRLD